MALLNPTIAEGEQTHKVILFCLRVQGMIISEVRPLDKVSNCSEGEKILFTLTISGINIHYTRSLSRKNGE